MSPQLKQDASLGNDLVWGVASIAKEINRSERQTFHLLETNKLPAKKVGGRWVSSKSALRRFFLTQLGRSREVMAGNEKAPPDLGSGRARIEFHDRNFPNHIGLDRRGQCLWDLSRPIDGTLSNTYLQQALGYRGVIPASLRHLRARASYGPALLARFGLATADDDVPAVQLTKLKPDGSGKADVAPNKIIIGKGAAGLPIVIAPPMVCPALLFAKTSRARSRFTKQQAWAPDPRRNHGALRILNGRGPKRFLLMACGC